MLLRKSVTSKKISRRILIYSACIDEEYPEILEKFKGRTKLSICLEEHHINKVAKKLMAIIYKREVKSIVVLTMDGSPHCLQLHHALEEIKNYFDIEIKHYVIEKGELIKVSEKSVKISRHLSEVEKLIS